MLDLVRFGFGIFGVCRSRKEKKFYEFGKKIYLKKFFVVFSFLLPKEKRESSLCLSDQVNNA